MAEVMVVTQVFETGTLTGINAGQLALAEVLLYSNDIQPTPSTLLGEYTEADYTGYALEALASATPSVSDAGEPELVYQVGEFRPTGTTIGNQIFGGLLTTAAGVLLAAWRFAEGPLPMESALDQITLVLRVRVSPLGGLVVTIS